MIFLFNASKSLRLIIILFKYLTVVLGVIFAGISGIILFGAISSARQVQSVSFPLVIQIFGILVAFISGVALVSIFPQSLRIRFHRPIRQIQARPTYGFVTLLSIGIGTTIGSPLFIVLPVNIVQYAMVSLISLTIAGLISVGIAWVYSHMYTFTVRNSIESVGGPGFLRIGVGKNSVTYFISRLSMWIANTALAAFSAVYFITFTFYTLPVILDTFGLTLYYIYITMGLLVLSFATWFIINAFFENRFLKTIGRVQIAMLIVLVAIIILQSLILGFKGGWNLSGFTDAGGGNIGLEILENTSYLFILFFGFQEIQSIVKETKDYSSIPLISRLFHLKPMERVKYVSISMIVTVVFSLLTMILVSISYYSLHPDLAAMEKSTIPAIYIVKEYIGRNFELLTLTAFLIADVTTFVPAFIAASRHLRSLSSDGFFPSSVKSYSWLFTVIVIFVLSFTSSSFLVEITDFMVLAAIGLISFSPFLARHVSGEKRLWVLAASVIIGTFSIIVDFSIFPIAEEVVLLGAIAMVMSYLVFDLLKLGSTGLQIFIVFFDLTALIFLEAFPTSVLIPYPSFLPIIGGDYVNLGIVIPLILLLTCSAILINLVMDVYIIKRVSFAK